jgi:hypothetical protein
VNHCRWLLLRLVSLQTFIFIATLPTDRWVTVFSGAAKILGKHGELLPTHPGNIIVFLPEIVAAFPDYQ